MTPTGGVRIDTRFRRSLRCLEGLTAPAWGL